MPPLGSQSTVRVRFGEGAPELDTLINGVPQSIGAAYLQVDGRTVNSQFSYASMTQFLSFPPGTRSLTALDVLGYAVGPIKSSSLSAGKTYTLILVGSYPHYRVLVFEEPASAKGAQLSLYEASPSVPSAGFGSFAASHQTGYKERGSAKFGSVVTVSLGASVSDFGGYAGQGSKPFTCGSQHTPCGDVAPAKVDTFDGHNVLPFHNASRLSLFLFDASGSSAVSVTGSLDR